MKVYEVNYGGVLIPTQLNDKDAKERGLLVDEAPEKEAADPKAGANKVDNEAPAKEAEKPEEKQAETPENKQAPAPENKSLDTKETKGE